MSASIPEFRARARAAVENPHLQISLENATGRFRNARNTALTELPHSEALRDHLKALRAATLANLAHHLETFERNATAAGARVHWARDAAEACQIVTGLAETHGVRLAVKSKSMTSEEIQLNQALTRAGVEPVETDLGEWIVQLAGETPSHIIAPAIHKTRGQVAALLTPLAGRPLPDDIPTLTAEARRLLREKFLAAGMGISGANLAVAETGSLVLVTNEGNGRLVTSAPPVHVAIVGLEKIAPTWQEAAVWLALLARSATGQPLSIYTSILTGPARPTDPDGPREVHIVLLDNGRAAQLGTPREEVLQCLRCGACLNVCPVYREAGGHAYGSPYSGPIGAVITPALFGLEKYPALPQASSLCGACLEVCPVRIDLPRMLLDARAEEVARRLLPWWERLAERAAAAILGSPRRMMLAVRLGRLAQRFVQLRGAPQLAPRSFREIWKEQHERS